MYEYNLALLFQRIAQERASGTAIRFSEREKVSYEELNRRANQTARWLLELGVGRDDVVCLSGTKTFETFACMIACLKIGALYCVLDPESPAERLRKILNNCKPKVLFAELDFLKRSQQLQLDSPTTCVEKGSAQFTEAVAKHADDNLAETKSVTGSNPAYIMFTSGSTGFPKGAVMTHANVLNLVKWAKKTYSIEDDDVLTNVNPLYFDNSVFDFYSALFNGACLVPFSKDEVANPKTLVDKVAVAGCTMWFSVPSLLIFLQTMRATDGKNLRTIRRFIFGGEGYPKAKLKLLYDTYADSSEFFNVYGPTECTCICSNYKMTEIDFDNLQGLPPLGYIAENFSYLILDDENKPVPHGQTGELCLLGPNVGRGYYNDSQRTAGSFFQNPTHNNFSEVMYKTGDLARLDPVDGKLYIEGRKDNQIKHMGYRVELEEIEAALNCLEYVSEAAALHLNTNGLSRLVAVVATRDEINSQRISEDLGSYLPSYMIPSVFHRERVLPKNANGKVDRRYLGEKYGQPNPS